MKNICTGRFLATIVALYSSAYAAEVCSIDNPIEIPRESAKVPYIKEQILQNPTALYSKSDIRDVSRNIKTCQNYIDNAISQINNSISAIIMDKQDLLKLRDIDKIEAQIEAKQKSREQILLEMRRDLGNINYKGLYLAVLSDIDVYASKERLSSLSELSISESAIRDINGVFIESLTEVKNHITVYDYIRSVVSGQMGVEKKYVAKTLRREKAFVYLAKINVAPLQESEKSLASLVESGTAATAVLDVLSSTPGELDRVLSPVAEGKEVIAEVRDVVSNAVATIRQENGLAQRRQANILQNASANLKRIDEEISSLRQGLETRRNEIRQLIAVKTSIDATGSDLHGAIARATAEFDSRIHTLTDKKMIIKEMELIQQNTNVIAEGIPAEDIAKTAINLMDQIESSYSKVEQFSEVTEVENFMLKSFETSQKKDIYRRVSRIWVYPIPGNNDNFELTVVAKFKVGYQFSRTYSDQEIASIVAELLSAPDAVPARPANRAEAAGDKGGTNVVSPVPMPAKQPQAQPDVSDAQASEKTAVPVSAEPTKPAPGPTGTPPAAPSVCKNNRKPGKVVAIIAVSAAVVGGGTLAYFLTRKELEEEPAVPPNNVRIDFP